MPNRKISLKLITAPAVGHALQALHLSQGERPFGGLHSAAAARDCCTPKRGNVTAYCFAARDAGLQRDRGIGRMRGCAPRVAA